jgi:HK97 family phage major capsid protein
VNTSIKQKHEELEKLRVRARTILAEYKDGLPAEQEVAVNAILEKANEIKAAIETETKMEQKKADLAVLDRFIDDPVYKIPHGVNGDNDERKILERAGWAFKNGMAYKTTSIGREVEMFGEDVFFGDIPDDDPDQARFFKSTRAAMSAEYKAAYNHLIRLTARAPQGAAFSMLSGAEQKALSEGTDTSGGFLVPPDIQAEMLARVAQTAVIRSKARVQPTNRDVLRFPAVKPNAATYNNISGASIYSSGFVGGWVGETPAFSDTDPGFQTLDIPVKKLRIATRLSNDFVNDAAVNVLAWLAMNGAENMALTEDAGFIFGDGTALQPMGLLNVGITTVDVEGSTADTISNTSASTGSAPKLIDLTYKLPAQYVGNAVWVMRRTIEGKIRKLVDGQNRYLWPPYTASGFADVPRELMGFPVLHSDWMPDDGQDTQPVLLLGDLSHYIIAQRTQITSLVLRERFADTDQIGIILFERVGANCFNTDAFRTGIC